MRKLALVLALMLGPAAASGCAHRQLTNRQVARGAVVVGVVVVTVGALYLYCDTHCEPQF